MRIKMYENFTSINIDRKFKSDVEDIFVELLDNHFLVEVNVANNNNRNSGYFKCDIKDYVLMLNYFMNMNYSNFSVDYGIYKG